MPTYLQETALVVNSHKEDREKLRRFFSGADYNVIATGSGDQALKLCSDYEGAIHLLVTDVNLPEMSGWKLAEAASKIRPGLVVLFLSANYVSEEPGEHVPRKPPAAALSDRISEAALLQLTQVLGRRKQAAGGRN